MDDVRTATEEGWNVFLREFKSKLYHAAYGWVAQAMCWRKGFWKMPMTMIPRTRSASVTPVGALTRMGAVVRGEPRYMRFTIMR